MTRKLSRRDFLRLGTLTAGGVIRADCTTNAPPTAPPTTAGPLDAGGRGPGNQVQLGDGQRPAARWEGGSPAIHVCADAGSQFFGRYHRRLERLGQRRLA